ncbi:hypothetical protein IAT38_004027 [Cryptococcus sp. DSM 104549]
MEEMPFKAPEDRKDELVHGANNEQLSAKAPKDRSSLDDVHGHSFDRVFSGPRAIIQQDRTSIDDLIDLSFTPVIASKGAKWRALKPLVKIINPERIGSGRVWDVFEGLMTVRSKVQTGEEEIPTLDVEKWFESPPEQLIPGTHLRVAIKLTEIEWHHKHAGSNTQDDGVATTRHFAESAVLNEGRKYENELEELQGVIVPRFYGLWRAKTRDGKLYYAMVLELMGESVEKERDCHQVREDLSDDDRVDIIKAYALLHHGGVCHNATKGDIHHLRAHKIRYPLTTDPSGTSPQPGGASKIRLISFDQTLWAQEPNSAGSLSPSTASLMSSERRTVSDGLKVEENVWDAYEEPHPIWEERLREEVEDHKKRERAKPRVKKGSKKAKQAMVETQSERIL